MPSAALKNIDYVSEEISSMLDDSNATVGSILKRAREAREIGLDRVSKTLRISENYLDALECDDQSRMPEMVYTMGFLRTYALFLGLDAKEIIDRFKRQFTQVFSSETLMFPAPAPERSIPSTTLVILASSLAIMVFAAWWYLRPSMTAIDEFQHLSPVITEGIDTEPEVAEENVASVSDSEAQSEPLAASESIEVAQPVVPVKEAEAHQVEKIHQLQMRQNGIYLAEAKTFTIEAKADSWVELKTQKGQVLISRVMKAGEKQEFQSIPSMIFSTGNAGGVVFHVNDKSYSGLGRDAEVIKGKALHFMSVPAEG